MKAEAFLSCLPTDNGRASLLFAPSVHVICTVGKLSDLKRMKKKLKKLPRLTSDKQAEDFVEKADLADYDLSGFKRTYFEFEEKDVSKDRAAYKTMVELSHQSGVPVIEIGRDVFVGFHQKEVARFLGVGKTGRKKNGLIYKFLSS